MMKRLRTILAISSLIIFLLTIERLYTEALTYEPLSVLHPMKEANSKKSFGIHSTNKINDSQTALKKETGIQPIILRKLFGVEKIELPPHSLPSITPPPQPTPETPPQMVLKGVILEPDGNYRAYIEIDGKRIISLRSGEGVDSITLTEIKERSASLKWKEHTIELKMR